jgi:hypothetical protein
MLEDVPQDIVFKTLKVSCACVSSIDMYNNDVGKRFMK